MNLLWQSDWLVIHCFLVELKFGNVGFMEGRKLQCRKKKTLGVGMGTNRKLNPHKRYQLQYLNPSAPSSGQEKKFEIPVGQYIFSFQLPPLKYYLPNRRREMFMHYQLHHLLGTVYSQ